MNDRCNSITQIIYILTHIERMKKRERKGWKEGGDEGRGRKEEGGTERGRREGE